MGTIRFFLLGKFNIEVTTGLIQKFEPQKARELLVYLLLNRSQPQSREQLTDILWGEDSSDQSKNYLRKSLWQLQSFLESCDSQELLIVDGEWLGVNQHYDFYLDVELLETAFRNTQGVQGRALSAEQAERIEQAVNQYRGDLLDGWYQNWCLYERERLQHLYLLLLDKLMDHCEVHGSYEHGLVYGERVLHYDRALERTHRRLMRMHYLAGDRTSALRQYRKCVSILKEELEVEPAQSTRLMYEMIRADNLDNLTQSNLITDLQVEKAERETLMAIFSHLSAFHRELKRMQNRLIQDMQVIQRTIKGN